MTDFYKLYPNFDLATYKLMNNDLSKMNDNELLSHYHTVGKNEHRIKCKDGFCKLYNFDLATYKLMNNDLSKMNDNELLSHYHTVGKNEHRIKCKDGFCKLYNFDLATYKLMNNDLSKMNDNQLLSHYHTFGKNEHRIIREDYPIFGTNFDYSQKIVCVYHPYHFTIGGGEKHISTIIRYFIKIGYFIILYNHSEDVLIRKTLSLYLTNDETNKIKCIHSKFLYNPNYKKKIPEFDYFIYVNNSTIPDFPGFGKVNVYHCQFPFDLNQVKKDAKNQGIVSSYQIMYVNSEFTKKYMVESLTKKNCIHNNIEILYPLCFESLNENVHEKIENTFVMVGRIFKPNPGANNKRQEIAIKIFNRLVDLDYKLYIIGSVKDNEYFKYLYDLILDHTKIIIYNDISDNEKFDLIQKTKYYIQLTGMSDDNVFNQEHFGISTFECLNYECFPICYNGGYSPYVIHNYENGILIDTETDLENVIKKIISKEVICSPRRETFHLEKYAWEYFEETIAKTLPKHSIFP